jgi:hypothetical protein
MPEPRPPSTPAAEVGPGFQAAPFTPGRYAAAVQRATRTRHALNVFRDEMTSSFVLDLEAGGAATACRGWRYLSTHDGPQVHDRENLREQLGYRGRWEVRDGWVHLELRLDDSVCPRVGEYSNLVPRHADQWHLRCVAPAPGTPGLPPGGRILACRFPGDTPNFGEDGPHVVEGVLPGPGAWLLLGDGNGLRLQVDGATVQGPPAPPAVRVEWSADAVQASSWENAF